MKSFDWQNPPIDIMQSASRVRGTYVELLALRTRDQAANMGADNAAFTSASGRFPFALCKAFRGYKLHFLQRLHSSRILQEVAPPNSD
jgi:hypothetical protein